MTQASLTYHEAQAMLGPGSAHPGGFAATLGFLRTLNLTPDLRVLECGCGTGRTACHLASRGLHVTGLERNPVMLAKARRRGEAEEAAVEWVAGDIRDLPFADASFDLLLVESVTIFNPAAEALKEYRRVVVPGGRVADLEMAARPGMSATAREEFRRFYHAPALPTADEWRAAYLEAGFTPVRLWGPHAIDLRAPRMSADRYPDPLQLEDAGAQDDPRVASILWENMLLMAANRRHLSYVGLIATRT